MEVLLEKINFISLIVATFIVIITLAGVLWRMFKSLEPYLIKLIDNVSNKLDDVVSATELNTCTLRDEAHETKIARERADKEREELRNIQIKNTRVLEETIRETNTIKKRQEKDFKVLNDHEERIDTLEGRKQLEKDRRQLEDDKEKFKKGGGC